MSEKRIEESLWFVHQDGQTLYPWYRHSGHHGRSAFWVSDGSNKIEDADPIYTVEELIAEVFGRNRSIWLWSDGTPPVAGLYRLGERAIRDWGAAPNLKPLVEAALRGASMNTAVRQLPVLIEKAIRDAGLDLIEPTADGAFLARVSGSTFRAWVLSEGTGAWVSLPVSDGARLGLVDVDSRLAPTGMNTIGRVPTAQDLYSVLHAARVLQSNDPPELSARVEARLAAIPVTERTQEVRRRIGQDVFREALFELWDGCCAISGVKLPPTLLRASHAKPWADSDDRERLDPFNGLLLAVHYDALFDAGLLAVLDSGEVVVSPTLDQETRDAMGLSRDLCVEELKPGHLLYLTYHRRHVAPWSEGAS